ncbi:MAG TPA: L-threonylcarbamoyladenylate synthase [Myxococcota bacterium]|nr:L-threonylcarbamoyladenylate synthase [Myxococcota bacterium]
MSGALRAAVERVRAGGLVAYPTETVWGLGADASSDAAVASLRRWKGRADDTPISVLIDAADALGALGCEPRALASRLADAFWPGPLTLVVHCPRRFAAGVARKDGAVGFRCSSHPVASAFAGELARAGVGPVTATSLNRSGEPSVRGLADARALCDAQPGAPLLLDLGADASAGPESTVLDLTGPRPYVLRWGAVERDELFPVLEESA